MWNIPLRSVKCSIWINRTSKSLDGLERHKQLYYKIFTVKYQFHKVVDLHQKVYNKDIMTEMESE